MRVDKQTSYSNTYSYNRSSKMKCKRVGKKNANTNNTPMCYRRGNWRTEKPLRDPLSGNRSTKQSVGIHGLVRDPPSLIYPLYLSPPSSYSNKASRNRVLSSFSNSTIRPIAAAKPHWLLFDKSPKLPKLQNTLYTLKMCELCLGTNLLSMYDNRRGKEKRLEWFLTKNE